MRNDNFMKELELILLMSENRSMTVKLLADRMHMSIRTIYYYLEAFRDAGFHVSCRDGRYSLDKDSPFFNRLFRRVRLSDEEMIVIRGLLDKVKSNSDIIIHLRRKLATLNDPEIINPIDYDTQADANTNLLYEAIRCQKLVALHNYSSPNSGCIRPRIVEPFMFLGGNEDVRCYEITSKMNKTFKISRIGRVEILADDWQYEAEHRKVFTDLFMFSGETRYPISLRLGLLAHNILIEEKPKAKKYLTQEAKTTWRLDIDVCNYAGIGRFVIGLMDDIEIIKNDEFREYIRQKAEKIAYQLARPAEANECSTTV